MPFNIANQETVTTYVQSLCDGLGDGTAKWLGKRVRGQIAASRTLLEPLTPLLLTAREWPGWVYQRVEAGEALYVFPEIAESDTRRGFDASMQDLAQWLRTLHELASPVEEGATPPPVEDVQAALRALEKVVKKGVQDAFAMVAAWRQRMANRHAQRADPPGCKTVLRFDDGSFVARLSTLEALRLEGRLMGNCVGSGIYDSKFLSRTSVLFSLRDAGDTPHVTIEYENRRLNEFRGKGNNTPHRRYRPRLIQLFNHLGLPPTAAGTRLLAGAELVHRNGQYGTLEDLAAVTWTGPDGSVRYVDAGDGSGSLVVKGRGAAGGELRAAVRDGLLHIDSGDAALTLTLVTALRALGLSAPPSVFAVERLNQVGVFYDGQYRVGYADAERVYTFPDGHAIGRYVNPDSKQELLFYLNNRGERLATFAFRYQPEVDRNRLYIVDQTPAFQGDAVAANLTAYLNHCDVFLSDARTGDRLHVMFCRPSWLYLNWPGFEARMNQMLAEHDVEVRVGVDEHGRVAIRFHRLLRRLGTAYLEPYGDQSPFHVLTELDVCSTGHNLVRLVQALNRLDVVPRLERPAAEIVYERQMRIYCVAPGHAPDQKAA